MKTTVLLLTIFIAGLSAGLFYAWMVSVIPGTKRIPDRSYLNAMQEINRAILNPGFFAIFLGAILLMIVSSYLQFSTSVDTSFWLLLSATLVYLVGTFGVTILGNVPMNEALDLVQIDKLSIEDMGITRRNYEGQWNRFHLIRTLFSVISFILLLLALLYSNQPNPLSQQRFCNKTFLFK